MKIVGLLVTLVLLAGCSKPPVEERKIKFYQSSMHPWITSDKPGNCTICGMKLVPVYEGQQPLSSSVVSLNQQSINVLNVATVPARKMDLTKSLRVTGIIEDDENLHRVIAAFYDGRIDQVYVDHVGQYIEKGKPLASIYSPELLYILREYQNAAKGGNQAVARNSAQRLVQFGLNPEQVEALARQPETVYTIDLQAPISGTVVTKKAYKGQYIKTGEPLFEMGDLARMWFHAEVYERDLPDIRVGQKASVTTPTVPGRQLDGVVTFIDPNFDPKTRSTKVRIELDNPKIDGDGLRRLLPHRVFAEADIHANVGVGLIVPRSAVLQDGRRSIVYVEKAPGAYEQREVSVGRAGDEGFEILHGLQEGDKVVTQGNLMIDAEAQIKHVAAPAPMRSPSDTAALASPEVSAFLTQLARVSEALAAEDSSAAIQAGQSLSTLAAAIPSSSDDHLAKLKALTTTPTGSDLKALRESFLPWSTNGAALALALQRSGQVLPVHVFECPMTGDSFPGAPSKAKWVQSGAATRNPYFGNVMLDCGFEVKP